MKRELYFGLKDIERAKSRQEARRLEQELIDRMKAGLRKRTMTVQEVCDCARKGSRLMREKGWA